MFKSKIHSKNYVIAGRVLLSPDRSLGNLMTLKSPPIHQGNSYQLCNPASSSYKNLLSLSTFGPYKPTKAHTKLFATLKRTCHSILPHKLLLQFLHNSFIPHHQDSTRSPIRCKISPIRISTAPNTSNYPPRKTFQLGFFKHTISVLHSRNKCFIRSRLFTSFNLQIFQDTIFGFIMERQATSPWIFHGLNFLHNSSTKLGA